MKAYCKVASQPQRQQLFRFELHFLTVIATQILLFLFLVHISDYVLIVSVASFTFITPPVSLGRNALFHVQWSHIAGTTNRKLSTSVVGRVLRHKNGMASTNDNTKRIPHTTAIQDDVLTVQFQPFFDAIVNATILRDANTINQGHDSFRYEWGTWVTEESLLYLMQQVKTIQLQPKQWTRLLTTSQEQQNDNNFASNTNQTRANGNIGCRYRVAGGQDWDVLLHVLPPSCHWQGRWPTGSWSILKTLTGFAEIYTVSGRDLQKRGSVRTLRGNSDGSLASGSGNDRNGGGGGGEDPIKYVGGPMRCYKGLYGNTVLLEVVIRPPIGKAHQVKEKIDPLPVRPEETFSIALPPIELILTNSNESEDAMGSLQSATDILSKLNSKMGISFDSVGGLDAQLTAIARRVLASRANPVAAKRLGVSHVRGILLSGPPGCGKTLLARELARILGARKPQIVNGPEILDKYIGEAEKKVRDLFAPAEMEYQVSGDDSALHIIILDEMDAIARKRGSMTSDTTGVRDSVVNQLLAKMDGVKEASNVLVIGLTNRPELLDPALLRPGRLEVQLRIELPDLTGRRDILRIHTRQMRQSQGVSDQAIAFLESTNDDGLSALTEHFSGAELAGLVRSAASFALTRSLDKDDQEGGVVTVVDLEQALLEVRPALGKQDQLLKMRFPLGISPCSPSIRRVMRDLERFTAPLLNEASPRIQSLLLVGASGGSGATALAAWAASKASSSGRADYVRFVTALDLLTSSGGAGEEARASALVERFVEARELPHSFLVLDDVDQLCAGHGPNGYSNVMVSTLRALLRSPPSDDSVAKSGGQSIAKTRSGKSVSVLAATSRSDAACAVLYELFDETVVVPLLQDKESVRQLLSDSFSSCNTTSSFTNIDAMADLMIKHLGEVGCKTALRLAERVVTSVSFLNEKSNDLQSLETAQIDQLVQILDDLSGDEMTVGGVCSHM